MSFKIKDSHWEILMSFLEEHPQMALGRCNGPNGRQQNKELWNELATQLNSEGTGERSADKWQKTWTDFKYSLKKKASAVKNDQSGTGGGPGKCAALNNIELRALNILGDTFAHGVGSSEVGMMTTGVTHKEKVPFRNSENTQNMGNVPSTSRSEENERDHDYSYRPPEKRKKTTQEPMKDAYDQTIFILRDIKNVLDTHLGQIADNLDRLVTAIEK